MVDQKTHISTSGKRVACNAKEKPCPRGGHRGGQSKAETSFQAAATRGALFTPETYSSLLSRPYRGVGMHWADSPNPRMRMLAKRRAYKVENPSIDVQYGSRGGTVILRNVDEGAEATFLNGACVSLAWAMHVRSGLPFAVFTAEKTRENERWTGHVGLLTEDNQILDITGTRSAKDVARNFKGLSEDYTVMDAEQLKAALIDEKYHKDPLKHHGELEQLVVEDFAQFILEENDINAD